MKIKYIATTIIILLFSFAVFAEDSFGPAQSDIKTADQKLADKDHIHKKPAYRNVYNAPIGAGYILIRFFQIVISPQDGPSCRYNPTCSNYGSQAVRTHGVVLGSLLAGDRLIRCNPYNEPGDDPVPERIFGEN